MKATCMRAVNYKRFGPCESESERKRQEQENGAKKTKRQTERTANTIS